MKKIILFSLLIAASQITKAQTSIATSGGTPDASAMLDVQATDKGMLIPRVALTSTAATAPITSPLTSLMVYNTASVSDVTPGYYYWNGTSWQRIHNGTTNLSGSGTADYLARWTPSGSVLGIGVSRDNGTNVGIDIAPGTVKLKVAGDIESNSQIRATGWLVGTGTGQGSEIGVSGGYSYFMGYNRTAGAYVPSRLVGSTIDLRHSDASTDLFIATTGYVGVNTSNPLNNLHVNGGMRWEARQHPIFILTRMPPVFILSR
jgi:trimeric autotransporter adhesin